MNTVKFNSPTSTSKNQRKPVQSWISTLIFSELDKFGGYQEHISSQEKTEFITKLTEKINQHILQCYGGKLTPWSRKKTIQTVRNLEKKRSSTPTRFKATPFKPIIPIANMINMIHLMIQIQILRMMMVDVNIVHQLQSIVSSIIGIYVFNKTFS